MSAQTLRDSDYILSTTLTMISNKHTHTYW